MIYGYKFYFYMPTGRQYTPRMRTLIYSLLNEYTSSSRMKEVIQNIALFTGMEICDEDIPSHTTIERMQLELGVISDLLVIIILML